MRKLDRASVPVPECLQNIPEGWVFDDLRGAEKDQIRACLRLLQKSCCSYCERRTGENPKDGHIEHFRKQADHPNLTLAWDNLFWSCNDENTCGKHKDSCTRQSGAHASFDVNDLIDPSNIDPDNFFIFVSDGSVAIKDEIAEAQKRIANETLRVFNLAGSAYLRKAREDAVNPYKDTIDWLLKSAPHLLVDYIESEKEKVGSAPFSTAIKHFFRDYT